MIRKGAKIGYGEDADALRFDYVAASLMLR
ncbi:hypothetical protein J2T13_000222 [Paenibacillus sp. DS2015]